MYSFRTLCLCILAMTVFIPTKAQVITPSQDRDVVIAYIAKDPEVPNELLKRNLEDVNRRAVNNDSPAVFYFANSQEPTLILVNTEDAQPDEFDTKAKALADGPGTTSFNCEYDHNQLLSLIERMQLINFDGSLNCRNLELYFFVGKTFWQRKYNEQLIAALWFELNLARFLEQKQLNLTVYVTMYEVGKDDFVDGQYPYGTLAPENLNTLGVQRYRY